MKRHRLGSCAAMLLLSLTRVAGAQNATNPEVRQVINGIKPNTLLRIETSGIHTGTFLSSSADSLLLREITGSVQLGIRDIRGIAQSQRYVIRDAVMGGIIGGIGFGAIGLITGGSVCGSGNIDCKDTHLGGLAAGGLLGLVGGTIGGAAIGLTQRGWRFIYPAPE